MALVNQFLEAQSVYQQELLSKTGVVGVGIGYKNGDQGQTDELSVVALVDQKRPIAGIREEDLVPRELNGIKTDVMEVGLFRAQMNTTSQDRWRPTIPAGISIAHYMVTAGTIGAIVYDAGGVAYILSNNHVLANSNDALISDPILQPGPADGGQHGSDAMAILHRYAKISYTDENIIGDANPIIGKDLTVPTDPTPNPPTPPPNAPPTQPTTPSGDGCAAFIISFADTLAKMNDPNASVQVVRGSAQSATPAVVDPTQSTTIRAQAAIPNNQLDAALALPIQAGVFQAEIMKIGAPSGTMPVSLGMKVRKYGRTTQYTEGTVTLINATIDVGYRTLIGNRTARFVGQVMTTGMSQGGDSGSLIVDGNSQNAVGLLFAGSGTATIFTPIDRVLKKLGVSLTR
ncbi:MAG: hypothetical protein WBC91_25660 [Phototrophicaceae bacterium]